MAVDRTRAVFLDKDGTLITDVPYNVDPTRMQLEPGVGETLAALKHAGFMLIVVSNQSGVAHGIFTEAALLGVERRLQQLLMPYKVQLDGFYYCPHHTGGIISPYAVSCECRKPLPGLIRKAAREHAIDLEQSWMIGDILNDVEAGNKAGCRTILINNGNETDWNLAPARKPHHTVETFSEVKNIVEAAQKNERRHYEISSPNGY